MGPTPEVNPGGPSLLSHDLGRTVDLPRLDVFVDTGKRWTDPDLGVDVSRRSSSEEADP